MARNRKRAKERQSRRLGAQVARPGLATHGDRDGREFDDELDAPSPLEHATPDVELADAQLALGRPELAGSAADDGLEDEDFDSDDGDLDETSAGAGSIGAGGGGGRYSRGGELAAPGGAAPAHRVGHANRLINFLQGSWRELQRVQWPDRRQVMQATGVVIGFVIVAGVYLGVADSLAGKLVNLILK